MEIEAGAKRRLADEYDAAQERGELAKQGQRNIPGQNVSTLADAEISAKDIHEARIIRDAEDAAPGTGAGASREWSESDTRALRKLVAFQNLFYLRNTLNQVEVGANHAFGIPMKERP